MRVVTRGEYLLRCFHGHSLSVKLPEGASKIIYILSRTEKLIRYLITIGIFQQILDKQNLYLRHSMIYKDERPNLNKNITEPNIWFPVAQ
jgi:hypothetical protein